MRILRTLSHKISGVADLHGIVRAMKALALSNIGLFEQAVQALNGYAHTIETGLGACFRAIGPISHEFEERIRGHHQGTSLIVFGSDHGLVGPFNDVIAGYVNQKMDEFERPVSIQAVGEQVAHALAHTGLPVDGISSVPNSVSAITPLVGEILYRQGSEKFPAAQLHVFFNQPLYGTAYDPISQQILPFDDRLRSQWMEIDWPSHAMPQLMGSGT